MSQCARCTCEAIRGERFCKPCRRELLAEMQESGYLETGGYGGHKGQSRTSDQKENVYETKHGTGHG